MNKFFRLHDYPKNVQGNIPTFTLNRKLDIWCNDVRHISGISVEELISDEFERPFTKKYLYERYYYGNAKELYELKMGSMTFKEYMTKFLEILRYVPYLKDEMKKFQRFINGFPLAFKDNIKYDEP